MLNAWGQISDNMIVYLILFLLLVCVQSGLLSFNQFLGDDITADVTGDFLGSAVAFFELGDDNWILAGKLTLLNSD